MHDKLNAETLRTQCGTAATRRVWSAPAERSGDGALACGKAAFRNAGPPLRGKPKRGRASRAPALQNLRGASSFGWIAVASFGEVSLVRLLSAFLRVSALTFACVLMAL